MRDASHMKNFINIQKQGLYDPAFEHDACGIGLLANIKGKKSNELLRQSLSVLCNLAHRGGVGSEPNSGDGAGVLLQLPHAFFKKVCTGFELPAAGDYGVGMLFMPRDVETQKGISGRFETITAEEGLSLLGWRDVPVDPSTLGETAVASMPFMRQVFVARGKVAPGMAFERALYIARRRLEKDAAAAYPGQGFYVASFSSATIVYKGMLTPEQVGAFYPDLHDDAMETAIALVHSRYSTNTFPSWNRAHPNRYLIHNGEINTLCGNVNFMNARESMLQSDVYGGALPKVLPIINPDGSDSAMFDNTVEFLHMGGMPLHRIMMLMIPEPWDGHESMSAEKKAFYEYQSCLMEPWDGPVAMGFTDGVRVGAVLDRNGLRPARYTVTTDDFIVLSSETGVLDIPPEKVVKKERLHPGRMLLIDTEAGRILTDEEIKNEAAREKPYAEILAENLVKQDALPKAETSPQALRFPLEQLQKAFGYTYEDLRTIITPLARDGADPVGAMGNDIPLAVLSEKPQLLYEYFKQLFAQVTNPPIDALREAVITSSKVLLGSEGNLLDPTPASARRVQLDSPFIDNAALASLRELSVDGLRAVTLPIVFHAAEGGAGLKTAMDNLCEVAKDAVRKGVNILILSDRGVNKKHAAIPALLAVAGLHHFLVREKLRCNTSIVLESGEPHEVHHFATLLGYGVSAVNPYLALESVAHLVESGFLTGKTVEEAQAKYLKGVTKGVIKVLSKMGISTIQSYQGAQIFEALGLEKPFIDQYFTGTPSRVGGIGLDGVATEAAARHAFGFPAGGVPDDGLESGGKYQYRHDGEYHLYNPLTIHALQEACRAGDFKKFKEYTALINGEAEKLCTLRGLLKFKPGKPIPLDEVESVESLCARFKTGAMSFGSISKEAHEAMAVAMNRIGGKSNTGEGGENPARFIPEANGDSRCSAIKQVASGRFGVTSNYLVHAQEIQIKMAQGAKPGEGGQLPGRKVYPWVAKVRYSTPGVGLISPPPHHDIYSIEDLKELIHDLKNANPDARISVKLVAETGVGTVAAGVAKALADVILISGYDGGTGASPRTSTRHAGLPWELGLAETHQTLVLNDLRSRVVVETDGKLMTGRDVAIAALLGAEEFGFATAPLVTLGCVMMRVCNLDTCPVGVATQNPRLRAKFAGDPQHVVNFMRFMAEDLREIMASLGFRTIEEMVGRTDMLEMDQTRGNWKTRNLDYDAILFRPKVDESVGVYHQMNQDHGLDESLDRRKLLALCAPAIEKGEKVDVRVAIQNIDRAACTILGSEITKAHGGEGLPDDTVTIHLNGSTGLSFGAFVPHGVTLDLEGDANDYIGKGLSGGKIIVRKPDAATFVPEENIIIGNVAFYGATSGEAYIGGVAGERFCVRNSGVTAVVEAVGDHGCEYMTGGRVAVLGKTGRNFAAGMSGGVAYVYDENGGFPARCNTEMVDLGPVEGEDADTLRGMLEKHAAFTGSARAKAMLADWDVALAKFVRVMPRDYERILLAIKKAEADGLSGDDAMMAAFEANFKAPAKAGVK
ncbi:Glutamate synthase (ferredoxin) [Ethanoligenens harbinense YUAN-3]|uniref:Glutamate synthase (Ferredoxin) n=2 Tax=Ethanoligenens harbinense TaxID=253239 RepID=E6U7R9_ETHHY|nr:Glutamate synthase (ferredoxin) [Ethanoligenens harbinense YUAN-3]